MNKDKTLFHSNLSINGQQKIGTERSNLWKKVTLGSTSGIFLGAVGIRTVDHIETSDLEEENFENADVDNTEMESYVPIYGNAPVAYVSNSMSFDQAFAAARAEVGPGGVFAWHGGIYGTYYETEWDSMSDEQKFEFAQSVRPVVSLEHVQINQTDVDFPEMLVDAREVDLQGSQHHVPNTISNNDNEMYSSDDDDVHIIGQGEIRGHSAVVVDLTGNYEADAVIIDVDDNGSLTNPDIVVYRGGMASTIGGIAEGNPPISLIGEEHQVNMENPDVAPDMPDYMDDAPIM
jgi:hypothetical protein